MQKIYSEATLKLQHIAVVTVSLQAGKSLLKSSTAVSMQMNEICLFLDVGCGDIYCVTV